MSQTTTNYGFTKPELTDVPDITVLSQNWEMIDSILKSIDMRNKLTIVSEAANANSYATRGVYFLNNASNVPSEGKSGLLFVEPWSDSLATLQFWVERTTHEIYLRVKDYSWSAWSQISTHAYFEEFSTELQTTVQSTLSAFSGRIQDNYDYIDTVATALREQIGNTLVTDTIDSSLDHSKAYVYIGTSTTDINKGDWIYYDGTAWKSGGVYNSEGYQTDKTLTVADMAADAEVVGDEIDDLKSALTAVRKEEIATYFGPDFIELGNYILTTGGFNPSTKMFRTGYNNLPRGCQRIEAQTSRIFVVAYDRYGVYQGHSTNSGLELSKSATEPTTKVVQISAFFGKYPDYRFRLMGVSNPYRDITVDDAVNDLTFYVGQTDSETKLRNAFADGKAVKDELLGSSLYCKTLPVDDFVRESYNSYSNYISSTSRLANSEPIYCKAGTKIHFLPGNSIARFQLMFLNLNGKYISGSVWYSDGRTVTVEADYLVVIVFSGPTGNEEIDVSDYDATLEIMSPLYSEYITNMARKVDSSTWLLAQKNWSAFFPANTSVTYTVENGLHQPTPVGYCWVKFYPYVLSRGTGRDITLAWTDLMTQLSDATFETSPNGVTNCLKIASNQVLVYDLTDYQFKLVGWTNLYVQYPNAVVFAQVWAGLIVRGVIWDGYQNQFVRETKVRFEEYASLATYSVPSDILDDIERVNNAITYTYPNTIKIGWITDTHTGGNGKNKPLDYCVELTKYGQIPVYMITGDLNYYINEQTLLGTQEMMSTVARHIAEMVPYSQPLPCRGNHDGINGSTGYTTAMFNSAVLKPYIKEYGSYGQYYYDVGDKIRIIMLNSCDDALSRKGFSLDEIEWLNETLVATPAGYGVIVAAHHPINADYAGSVPANNLPSYYTNVVTAIQNFKQTRTDCDFIAYLFGHMHADNLGVKDGFIQCSLVDSSTDNSVFSSDILCVDTTEKVVHLVRLGEGTNRAFGYGANNLGPIN